MYFLDFFFQNKLLVRNLVLNVQVLAMKIEHRIHYL